MDAAARLPAAVLAADPYAAIPTAVAVLQTLTGVPVGDHVQRCVLQRDCPSRGITLLSSAWPHQWIQTAPGIPLAGLVRGLGWRFVSACQSSILLGLTFRNSMHLQGAAGVVPPPVDRGRGSGPASTAGRTCRAKRRHQMPVLKRARLMRLQGRYWPRAASGR